MSQTAANVKTPSNQNAFAGRTFGLKKRHAIQNDFDTQRTQLLGHVGVEHFARPTLLQANTPALVAQIGRAFRAAKLMAFAYWSLKTQGAA